MASFAYFWSFLATLNIFGQYLRKTFENAENLINEGSAKLSFKVFGQESSSLNFLIRKVLPQCTSLLYRSNNIIVLNNRPQLISCN